MTSTHAHTITTRVCAAALLGVGILSGCASSSKAEPKAPVTLMTSPAHRLVGEWMQTDEKGVKTVASVITVTSAKSALREVMFPGAPHEMTNMYHMDGDSMVLTHYCAIGNQPRMKAKLGNANQLDFQFESVTNQSPADQEYMGRCVMTFKDADTIDVDWTSYKNGKESSHTPFHLTRKR
ncbi:MAG: hypothetical protein AABZ53_05470 [Planctomycetota bacterium]